MAGWGRVTGAVAVAGLLAATAGPAGAADQALYPSGPPNGVGYLRFANLTGRPVTVTSAFGKITIPNEGAQRVRRYDPVTPGTELTGTVQDAAKSTGGKSAPTKVSLTANEFVTIAVASAPDGGISVRSFRETPSDFNASKATLALYNVDDACPGARLLAGDKNTAVIDNVAPGASSRRTVNPVAVTLSVACGVSGAAVPVTIEPLAAGERYSVFVYAAATGQPSAIAVRDETASFPR